MKTFTYPFIAKIVYRYANIPVTFILGFYLMISAASLKIHYIHYFGVLINAVLIYVINRYYFRSYKIMPYKIEADDEKLVCSDYSFQNKVVTVYFKDIESISGGIFSGTQTKPIKIYDGKQNLTVSFSTHLKNFNELLTYLLSKVRKDVYEQLLNNMTKIAEDRKDKLKRK